MTHYSLEALIDFVRKATLPAERISMQQHLDVCAKCAGIVRIFKTVADWAAHERNYFPPANEVRLAKALSGRPRPVQRVSASGPSGALCSDRKRGLRMVPRLRIVSIDRIPTLFLARRSPVLRVIGKRGKVSAGPAR